MLIVQRCEWYGEREVLRQEWAPGEEAELEDELAHVRNGEVWEWLIVDADGNVIDSSAPYFDEASARDEGEAEMRRRNYSV